jgi:hypothetical protein
MDQARRLSPFKTQLSDACTGFRVAKICESSGIAPGLHDLKVNPDEDAQRFGLPPALLGVVAFVFSA